MQVVADVSVFNGFTQCFHCRASFSANYLFIYFETNILHSLLLFIFFILNVIKIILYNELMWAFHKHGLSGESRAHLS